MSSRTRSLQILSLAALGALALGACTNTEKKVETSSPKADSDAAKTAKAPDAKGETPKAEAGDKVKVVDGKPPGDDRYELKIETPEATSGQESKVTVRVVPRDPWHMNLEFPTSLKVAAPDGVSLAKADLKKGDAAELTETGCQFDVGFTPASAGDQTFTGKFKFAVCQDEACSPVTEEIEFKVAVK